MVKRQAIVASLATTFVSFLATMFVLVWLVACNPTTTSMPTSSYPLTNTPTPNNPKGTSPPLTTVTATRTAQGTPSPTPINDCLVSGGKVQSGLFYSDHLQSNLSYRIYLPPCYQPTTNQRFPVIYLLHGLSYNEDQWLRLGLPEKMDTLIAEGTIAPFIVVLPREAIFAPSQTSQYANALTLDLVPWIDGQYRTLADRSYRGIGGLSRGASWAIRIGFTNYDTYSSVGAHSLPLFEADGNRIETWLTLIPRDNLPFFFIDIGRRDPEVQSAETFALQLDDHNIPHEWYLFNGDHSESYWSSHLEIYLRWYARNW